MPRQGYTGPLGDRKRYLVPDVTRYRRGGIGVVFEAQITRDRPDSDPVKVGIKMLTGIDENRFAKLLDRSEKLCAVTHPNLARHLECFIGPVPTNDDVDEDESDQFFAAHEWVDGESLRERLGNADPRDVLNWGSQIAGALDHLHAAPGGGFAHRDVHARNIIIRSDNIAVLIDYDTILWGEADDTNVASLTSLGARASEPGLSGAQAEDVKGLAATMLRAFARDEDSALRLAELQNVATSNLQGVAKDPIGAISGLVQILHSPEVSASSLVRNVEDRFERQPPRFRTPSRSRVIGALAALAVAVVLVAGVAYWSTERSERSATRAVRETVTRSDLPTAVQVASILPNARVDQRSVAMTRGGSTDRAYQVSHPPDCWNSSWDNAVQASSGREASYFGRESELLPYSISVTVYQFETEQAARKTENFFATFSKKCDGKRSNQPHGTPTTYQSLQLPQGFRGTRSWSDETPEIRNLDIVSLQGRHLVSVYINSDDVEPSEKEVLRLARLARESVGRKFRTLEYVQGEQHAPMNIRTSNDLDRLKGAPKSFKSYLSRLLDDSRSCGEVRLGVDVIRMDGYARGRLHTGGPDNVGGCNLSLDPPMS